MMTKSRFPPQEEMSNMLSCSPRTVSTRLSRLHNNYILYHTYIIDVTRLGYQTFALISHERNQLLKKYEHYSLGTLPISLGLTRGALKVFQIPFWRHDVFSAIMDGLDPLYNFTLTDSYLCWNLTQLTPNPSTRWKYPPPILRGLQWNDKIIIDDSKVFYSLVPDITTQIKITTSHAKFLSFYYTHGTGQDVQLAEYTGLNNHSIARLWQDILEYQLIYPYTHVRNVGLDIPLWFVIVEKSPNQSNINRKDMIARITDHLRYFPFVKIFSSLETEDNQLFMLGEMRIPSTWYEDFAIHWEQLSDYDVIPLLGVTSQKYHLKRNIDVSKTYQE